MCDFNELIPADGSENVPANLPGVDYIGAYGDFPSIALNSVDGETLNPIGATLRTEAGRLVATPTEAFPAGATIQVAMSGEQNPDCNPDAVRFQTGPAATLPSDSDSLGELGVEQTIEVTTVPSSSGSCVEDQLASRARISLTLSSQASPWSAALYYEVMVDGEVWGRAPERTALVYATCDGNVGTALGEHEIWMRARLAGTDTTLESEHLTVRFSCDETDAGVSQGDGGGLEVDAGSGSSSSGSGCSVSSSPGSNVWALAWALLLGLCNRRRR